MTNKHTPGPWSIYEVASAYNKSDYSIEAKTANGNPCYIGKVWGQYNGMSDAHLIAAAPDMLDALEKLSAAKNCNYTPESFYYEFGNLIEAVLKKAKGE